MATGPLMSQAKRKGNMDSFSLDIDMGNAAMKSGEDVADALRQVAEAIVYNGVESGRIHDANGNTVGGWGFDQLRDKRPAVEAAIRETIEATLDGAAKSFREAPEDYWTGREVAELLEAAKAASAGAR